MINLVLAYNSRSNDYSLYTEAALVDELTRELSSKNDCDLLKDDDGDLSLYLFRPYLNQAEGLIYKINVYERPPEFVIWEEDIPEKLIQELLTIGKSATKRVITNVVRRIYESVDPAYFHTCAIFGKTPWRISKNK